MLLVFTNNATAGGGWTLKKGDAYLKLSEWWLVADQHYTSNGLIDPNSTTGIFNTGFYAEYGFSDRFTGLLYAPFFSRSVMNNQVSAITGETLIPGGALNSLGDFDVGLKYGILKKYKIQLAATIKFGLAFGNEKGGEQQNLQTGDGEYNQLLQLDAGIPFQISGTTFYSNFYAGFNNRTEGFSDDFLYGVEVGAALANKKLWLIGKINGSSSFKNGSLSGENSTGIFANNAAFLNYSLGASVYFTKAFGVAGEVAIPISGEVTFAAPSYSLGLFLDLKR